MQSDGSKQDELAAASVSAGAGLSNLEYFLSSLIETLSGYGRYPIPERALCLFDHIDGSPYDLTVKARNFGIARIRTHIMVCEGKAVARFYTERPGRRDIGEHEWVGIGKFDLDQLGTVWLPDNEGQLKEETKVFDTRMFEEDSLRRLIYRIYHWIATSEG